jgi:CubicO group peptidase (beta-lactamase class C family)
MAEAEHWATRLEEAAVAAGVPGAVLGIWSAGEATVVPYGVLSTRTGVPTTADSVFQVGSITKTWTATMLAQLVAEVRLDYDTTVAELLPGVPVGRVDSAAEVTVRHLLSHSSGLDGDIFEDTGRGDDCVEKYVALLTDADRAFAPGAAYSYCNSGFVLLGRIIEVLDGRTWDESLRARLVEPLGLTDTVTLPEEAILRRAAAGHHGHPDAGKPYGTWGLPRAIGPAGLITMPAGELLTWGRLQIGRGVAPSGERLLAEDAATEMWQQQLPLPDQRQFAGIGLSWRLARWSEVDVIAHDGGTLGQSARLRVVPERDFAVCVLTNSTNGDALGDRMVAEVFDEEAGIDVPPAPSPDDDARPTDLSRHLGRYERRGVAFDVLGDDQALRVTVIPGSDIAEFEEEPETVDLLPADDTGDRFVGRSDPAEAWWSVVFSTLPDGRPQLYSAGRVAPRVA